MINFFKRNIFIVFGISLLLVLFDIFTDWRNIGLVGLSFILIIFSLFISHRVVHNIILILGVFFLILSLLIIKSIWVLILVIILYLILFRTEEGNEFYHIRDAKIYPKGQRNEYAGIKLIEPQSVNRQLLHQEAIIESYKAEKEHIIWDDINMVYFGGSNIIDLGNTIIPDRETTIVIRKLYGRTRIIIPNDVGLKLNASVMSGAVVFEGHRYPLTGQNLKWMSPEYPSLTRKLNVMISVAFGDIEVIFT